MQKFLRFIKYILIASFSFKSKKEVNNIVWIISTNLFKHSMLLLGFELISFIISIVSCEFDFDHNLYWKHFFKIFKNDIIYLLFNLFSRSSLIQEIKFFVFSESILSLVFSSFICSEDIFSLIKFKSCFVLSNNSFNEEYLFLNKSSYIFE